MGQPLTTLRRRTARTGREWDGTLFSQQYNWSLLYFISLNRGPIVTKTGDSEPTVLMRVMLMSSGASGTTIHTAETRLLEVLTATALLLLEASRGSLALPITRMQETEVHLSANAGLCVKEYNDINLKAIWY